MSVGGDGRDPEGFLSRWSRRKLSEAEQPHEGAASPAEFGPAPMPEDAAPQEELDSLSDAEVLEKLKLPDPDEMKAGDDFSVFMDGAVPTRLRNRALRKLWLSNTTLANLDELVDYGEDFTDAATVVENLQTAYKVGRGFLTDDPPEEEAQDAVLEDAAQAQDAVQGAADGPKEEAAASEAGHGHDQAEGAQSNAAGVDAPVEPTEAVRSAEVAVVSSSQPISAPIAVTSPNLEAAAADAPLFRRSRRMRFDFQDQGGNG